MSGLGKFTIAMILLAALFAVLWVLERDSNGQEYTDRINKADCAALQIYTAMHTRWLIEEILNAPDSLKPEKRAAYNEYIDILKNEAVLQYFQIDHPEADSVPSIYR